MLTLWDGSGSRAYRLESNPPQEVVWTSSIWEWLSRTARQRHGILRRPVRHILLDPNGPSRDGVLDFISHVGYLCPFPSMPSASLRASCNQPCELPAVLGLMPTSARCRERATTWSARAVSGHADSGNIDSKSDRADAPRCRRSGPAARIAAGKRHPNQPRRNRSNRRGLRCPGLPPGCD